jgi:hypothetical protein
VNNGSEFGVGAQFELRGASVPFFIKPADGLQLPEIMKWIKQTFALRFNWDDGRTRHIWGAQGRTRSVSSRQHDEPRLYEYPS